MGVVFFFQGEDGIRDLVRSRGLGDVYKRQVQCFDPSGVGGRDLAECIAIQAREADRYDPAMATMLSLIHI